MIAKLEEPLVGPDAIALDEIVEQPLGPGRGPLGGVVRGGALRDETRVRMCTYF